MTSTNKARDRAEELLHNLQRRAREWAEAEEGLVATVREMVEDRGFSSGEVKRRLDDALGRLKSNAVWERLRLNEAASTISGYRGELERRVDGSVQRLLSALPIVSKSDLKRVEEEVVALRKKFDTFRKKAKATQPAA